MSSGIKPSVIAPNAAYLPDALLAERRWIVWRLEWIAERERWNKTPYDPNMGRIGSSTDPQKWSDFQTAWRAYDQSRHLNGQAYSGIGFVLGDGWVGVDLDGCRNAEAGELEAWAARIIDEVPGYAEVSPSGTGVHIICRGAVPPGRRERDDRGAEHRGVAIYDHGRYFAITGQLVSPDRFEVAEASEQLTALHARLFPARDTAAAPVSVTALTDDEVFTRAGRAKNGGKFTRLWSGQWQGDYSSQSEADIALCAMLVFWTGGDASRTDALFRQSGLMRPKWEEARKGTTYGWATIQRAIELTTSFYEPGRREEPPAESPAAGDSTSSPEPEPTGYHAIDALITRNDLPAVYALAPQFARLNVTDWQITRQKLLQHFGKALGIKGLDAAVKAEKFKLRKAARENAKLPQIIISGDVPVRELVAQALKALHDWNDPPQLFLRSGELVRVVRDEQGRPSVQLVTKSCLRGLMARAADWLKPGVDRDQHISPPLDVVEDLASLAPSRLGFPPLVGVVEVPTLRPDGTVLARKGYDPQSGLCYVPQDGLNLPAVAEHPARRDVDEAKRVIAEAIGDFPFQDTPSLVNSLGLFLTPIVRPALNGCTPIALIDAPQAGTGKSLLVRLFSVIATGRDAAMMPYPKNDEEMGKQIAACLDAGRPLVCFDNLEGTLASPALALALTARDYEARILGVSKNMLVPNNATWVATGNNIKPAGDMPRRCYHIRLDARMTRPFQGRAFKHPDLIDWATRNRGLLLHALLTIARAWYCQGDSRPQHVPDPLGSFENWHRTVGSILANAGIQGFLGNLDIFLAQADETVAEWEAFLEKLQNQYGVRTFTAARVRTDIDRLEPLKAALPSRLAERIEQKKGAGTASRVLSSAFSAKRDMRHGESGIYLTRAGEEPHSKASLWCVLKGDEKVDASNPFLDYSTE